MHVLRTTLAAPVAAVLLCVALPSAIPTRASASPHASALIRVSACNPTLNVSRGPGYVGYAPGYWGGPYWGDVYGYRYYRAPMASTSPQLGIDYVNISARTMHAIEFGLIANGILKAEVRDVGTFSPNAEIKHTFGVSPNVFPIGTGLPRCVPLRITFADGTKWRNPELPPRNDKIYYHP